MPKTVSQRHQRGFTLIEMALVLVVVGLVVTGALGFTEYLRRGAKVIETNTKLDHIERALRTYAIQYGCLPCPADGGRASGDAANGRARDLAGTYADPTAGALTTATACTAMDCEADVVAGDRVVPWVTLGLNENDITDAWGNRITYMQGAVGNVQSASPDAAVGAPCGTITDASGVFTIADYPYPGSSICHGHGTTCSVAGTCYPAGGLTVQDAAGGGLTTAALYVLISHGPDRSGAYAADTGALRAGTPTSTAQVNNYSGAGPFVQDDPNDSNGANYFDDLVRWKSAPVFIQLCGQYACGN